MPPRRPPLANIAHLRANVRVEMLRVAASLGLDGIELDTVPAIDDVGELHGAYGRGVTILRELTTLYVGLGGDLELDPDAAAERHSKEVARILELEAALVGLGRATANLTAEDFPPRLADLVDPINEAVALVDDDDAIQAAR